MSFSQGTASHVVPLLARIVLAAAFIPSGWNKLTGTAHFSPAEATILRELGVNVRPDIDAVPAIGATFTIHPARWTTPSTAPWGTARAANQSALADDVPPVTTDMPMTTPPVTAPVTPPPPPAAEPIPVIPTPDPSTPADDDAVDEQRSAILELDLAAEGGSAMALHRVTLMVHAQGWPAPIIQAWAATAVELLGGALLLIGLFSRLWGLGLATTMGVAFWLTSWPILEHTSLFALPQADFTRLFTQVGLFVLAFGVLLTGPGALSLDRLLFRSAGADIEPPPA